MVTTNTVYIQAPLDFNQVYQDLLGSYVPAPKYVALACPVTHQGCYSVLVGSALVKQENPYHFVFANDVDYLTYVPQARWEAFINQIEADEWKIDGLYEGTKFTSYRKGPFNLILTSDFEWFKKFHKAAKLCAKLHLTSKDDRIAVHEAFLTEEKEDDHDSL